MGHGPTWDGVWTEGQCGGLAAHCPHPQVPTGRWSLDGRAWFATSTWGPHPTVLWGEHALPVVHILRGSL